MKINKVSVIQFIILCIFSFHFTTVFAVNKLPARDVVVLIHGLMRTKLSMIPLKRHLEQNGYQVYIYSYPSYRYTIQEHSIQFNKYVSTLLTQYPESKMNVVTHSLGGIIAREALSKLTVQQLKQCNALIMLAPPNQGSVLAKLSTTLFPFIKSAIKPLAQLSSDERAYVHHVAVPAVKIGIIAGRYDAKVPPKAAKLEGQKDPVLVNSTHTFIMVNSKTKELVVRFLKKGSFNG